MSGKKTVYDAVHGSISVSGVFLDLIETHEFQRLHDIKQLGLAYLVFPGAHHTRLEHSLGTYHVATLMCASLGLERDESIVIRCAALLHDIGHAPFSHTLEWLLKDEFGFTHDELTGKVILGEESIIPEDEAESMSESSSIPEILERHGISPKEVSRLIARRDGPDYPQRTLSGGHRKGSHFNTENYPVQIIQGPVDCDQIDYLVRDSHYTGIAHGVIDLDRLLSTLDVHNGDLVLESRGIPSAEGMLVARALMYTTVYYHKTVRIAELMLAKASENLSREVMDSARKQNDSGFIAALKSTGGISRNIITSLKYRRLYKTCLVWKLADMDDAKLVLVERLCSYGEKSKMEERIRKRAGAPEGSVIIDVPGEEILTSEPRMGNVNIGVLDGTKVRPLSRVSPIASSLQLRKVQDWGLMISCPANIKDEVRKAAERVLRD